MQIRLMTFVYVLMVMQNSNMKNDSYRATHHKKSLIFPCVPSLLMNDHRWFFLSFPLLSLSGCCCCNTAVLYFAGKFKAKHKHLHTHSHTWCIYLQLTHIFITMRCIQFNVGASTCASLSPLEHWFELAFSNELWLYIIMHRKKEPDTKFILAFSLSIH